MTLEVVIVKLIHLEYIQNPLGHGLLDCSRDGKSTFFLQKDIYNVNFLIEVQQFFCKWNVVKFKTFQL